MNDIERWAYIEQLFKDMMKLCDDIMRQCESEEQRRGVDGALDVFDWACQSPSYWASRSTLDDIGPWQGKGQGPISPDEAKRLLEDAKEFLREGE